MAATARRVTLQAIADELGISAKTVSNAFTHPDQLSAPLRAQVLDTAERLGYPGPNPLAAGLRRGRIGAIGVAYDTGLSYAFNDPVAVELLAGATSVAEAAEAGLLLVPGSVDPQRSAAAVTSAVVDGLLASSLPEDDPVLRAALARRIPLVVVDQPRPEHLRTVSPQPPPWVGIEDRAGARSAAEHLLDLGHRHLAVVSFPLRRGARQGLVDEPAQQATPYAVTRDRLAGYREAALAAGLDWASVPVVQASESSPAGGAGAAVAVLARHPRPTALLCLSDRLAEGAVQAARELGLGMPQDLSIVGFDDAEPASRLGLTTVHHPHRRKGELAAGALLALLEGRSPAPTALLPAALVVRTSTGSPVRSPRS